MKDLKSDDVSRNDDTTGWNIRERILRETQFWRGKNVPFQYTYS